MASNRPQANIHFSTPKRPALSRSGDTYTSEKRNLEVSPSQRDDICTRCSNETPVDKRARCAGCQLIFCQTCTGLSGRAFEILLHSGEVEDFKWHCKSCKKITPTLEKISDQLQELNTKQDERLTTLEKKMDHIEEKTSRQVHTEVKTGIHNAKKELETGLESRIREIVGERTREMDDRRRREVNLLFFKVPEGTHDNGQMNRDQDERNIRHIAEELGVEYLDMETHYRMGKTAPTRPNAFPRPIKVVMKDRRQRKTLLMKARTIKDIIRPPLSNVAIAKDLTKEQMNERKETRATSRARGTDRNQQEEPRATRQQSPIRNSPPDAQRTILSQEPHSIFDNITITDQTVIGGIHVTPSRIHRNGDNHYTTTRGPGFTGTAASLKRLEF